MRRETTLPPYPSARTTKRTGSSRRVVLGSFFLFAAILFSGNVFAITYTWTGGTTRWDLPTNWTNSGGGTFPGTNAADVVIIPFVANQPIIQNAPTSAITSITFTTAGTKSLTINTGLTLTVSGAVTLNSLTTANNAASIIGPGTLNCASLSVGSGGGGTAARTTILTYTTATCNITNNLTLNSSFAGGFANNCTFTHTSGTVNIGASLITVNPNAGNTSTYTMGNTAPYLKIDGPTPITKAALGTSTFTFNGTNATVEYSDASSYTFLTLPVTYTNLMISGAGTKTLSANTTSTGTLTVKSGATLALNTFTYGCNALSMENVGGAAGGVITGSATFTLGNAVTVTYSGSGAVNPGALISAPISMGGTSRTYTVADDGVPTLAELNITSSYVAGGGGLNKAGTGSLLLSGTNAFTGIVSVNAGSLIATTSVQALGTGTARVTMAGGSLILRNASGLNFARNVSVTANSTITSDNIAAGAGVTHTMGTLANTGFTLTIAGGGNVTSGTAGLTFGAVTHTLAPSTYTVNDPAAGGTLTLLTVAAVANSTFLTTFNGTGDVAQTGVFGNGSGGITYSGTGNLTLNQSNTFTGVLNVNNGTVIGTSVAGALGAGSVTMSGGNLTLRNASALNFARNVSVTANSTITSDNTAAGAGFTFTLGTLANTGFTLIIAGGSNVTSGTAGITFGAVTHTLAASTYTVNNPVAVGTGTRLSVAAVANSTFLTTFNGTGDIVQTGVFGNGSGGITYSGTGNLTLNQSNTFTGVLNVNNGTVIGTSVVGALGAGSVTMSGGNLILRNASALNFARNVSVTANSTITSDNAAAGAGVTFTLGTLANTGFTLTIAGGGNVTSGTAGITFGAVTHTLAAPTYTTTNPVGGGVTQISLAAVANSTFLTTFNGNGNVIQTGVFGNGSGGITYSGTGILTLNQANTFSGAFTLNSGTVNINSAAALGAAGSAVVINGGTINTTGITTASYVVTINGDFTFTGGAALIFTAGAISFTANIAITGSASTLTLAGPVSASGFNFTKLGAGSINLGSTSAVTVKDVTITTGTLLGTTNTMTIQGDFTNNATFTPGTGTVSFNGAIAQDITNASSFNNLVIANTTANVTAATNISVSTGFTTNANAVFDMGTFALTVATVTNNGTLRTANVTATPITAGKTWGGDVEYYSASGQTVVDGSYTDLMLTGGSRTLSTTTIFIAGSFVPGGGPFVTTGSTINFNSTGAQTIPAFDYNNLTISNARGSSAITLVNGGTIRVAGAFSVTATGTPTYPVTNNTFEYNGSGAQNIFAPFTYNDLIVSTGGTKTIVNTTIVICRTLTINDTAIIDVPNTANSLVITIP